MDEISYIPIAKTEPTKTIVLNEHTYKCIGMPITKL